MSASGHKQTFDQPNRTSALPPKADIRVAHRHVCFGPCVDGSGLARRIFTLQRWSVQPFVRTHMMNGGARLATRRCAVQPSHQLGRERRHSVGSENRDDDTPDDKIGTQI
jgi:hypothetical protein